MKPVFLFGIVLSLLLVTTILAQQTCPECYSNRGHLNGHGTSDDGRTKANIYIETPQGTPEYAMRRVNLA